MKAKLQLSEVLRATLEHDLASPKPKHQRRARAIQLLAEGKTVTDVVRELGVVRQTVYHWISHYGIDQNETQFRQALVSAILEALKEQDWEFAAFHSCIEQRLGRAIGPLDLRALTMIVQYELPGPYQVTDLFQV